MRLTYSNKSARLRKPMTAYIILRDKFGKTLTIPQAITALSRGKVFYSDIKYVGTFWASSWDKAKKLFDTYYGY